MSLSVQPSRCAVRFAVVVAVASVALAAAGLARAATYYVARSGSDAASGKSRAAAWRSVRRVNRACPHRGDRVLFQGGATFGDAVLMPRCSGTRSRALVFGSFGHGRAALTKGVWLQAGDHDIVIRRLDLSSTSGAVVASAASGRGVARITVRRSLIHDAVGVGVYAQPQDSGWRVVDDVIRHVGDSGIMNWSPGMVVAHDTISDTGWNGPALGYATHGVYAKGPDMVIRDNDFFANHNGQAISLRVHGLRVFRNRIHDTEYAMAFFNYDHQQNAGTVYVYDNRIWNVSGYAFYYNGTTDTGEPSHIGVVWDSNTALLTGGAEAVNLSEMTSASAEVANNIFTGQIGSGYRGCAGCLEQHNDWFGVQSNRAQGAGDIFVSPGLLTAPTFGPAHGSRIIDRGTVSARIAYTASCSGGPLAYCGPNPDIGAVEYGVNAHKRR